MVGFWRQLSFLLWKCVLVRKRQKFWLAVELIVPCILFIIIALVRTKDFSEVQEQCHYDSKGMLSAGLLPFVHSFFCSFSNRCNAQPTTGDETHFLFNDDGNSTRNESIIVDAIYYSSLQLRWIGKNPKKFEELSKGGAEIIHWLAQKAPGSTDIVKLGDLFDDQTRQNFTKTLNETTGIRLETAKKLMGISIEPGALETYEVFKELGMMELLLSNPLFCDERMFSKTFSFPKGAELSDEERDELCDILTPTELMEYRSFLSAASLPTPSRVRITSFLSSAQTLFEPTLTFFGKYSNFTSDQLLLALFCGEDPRDVIEQTINPNNDKTVETPFEKLRKQVIKFIQTVTPGKEQERNNTCTPVTYHPDMNCSSLESPILMKVRAALSGYILVTPDNPATRRVVERLNIPLKNLEYIRNLLYNYPSEALNLQDRIHSSDLWPASQKIFHYIDIFKNGQNPLNEKNVRFILEHIFGPSTDEYSFGRITKDVADIANKYTGCFLVDRFRFVDNEKDLEANAVCLMEKQQYFTGIVFEKLDANATEFSDFTTYKIRHYPEMVDSTTSFMDSRSNPFTRHRPLLDLKYLTFGFSFLQEAIDRAVISEKANVNSSNLGVYTQQEPFPCTVKDTFNVAIFMPLFLLISFIFPSALLVKNIVYEKEQKIKEQMRAMGLGDAVHFVSWALISLVLNFISVLIISIISKVAKIFDYTDYTLLLFVLILFLFASIAMSIFFSTLFTNANIATAATCVLWFVFFIPFQLLRTDRITSPTFNRISLLLPPTAMGHCFKLLESFNAMEKASWSDIGEMYNPDLGVSVELCMVMLVVDFVLFLVLAWYISAVAPGEYGVRQPLYFPFTLKYWAPSLYRNRIEFVEDEAFDIIPSSDYFDSEPTNLKLTVHINSMSKVYENGTKALDSLNLRLYEGQITGLLGHNGAGKTTTMSILCGLYAPSSGTAKIYSRDIRTDLRRVRDVLGICPQHNVIFSHLTVAEQLRLFAALKGVADQDLDSQVQEILQSVNLTEKADKLASTLSGGMKRRLCIGIAFIGGSKFVILDEPTAGVDVTARKDIWKLLQRNKDGRTILLSTHHMDEADVLSDRIAILSQGQCITVGSSVFLKRRFGNNLTLAMVKERDDVDYSRVANQIVTLGREIGLEVGDENDEEIVFKIPILTESEKLEKFFVKLDENLENLKLGQYGISAPTLQNIFVSLAPQKEYHVPKVSGCGWFQRIKEKLFRRRVEEEHNDLIGAANPALIENNMPQQNNEIEEVKFEDFEKPDLLSGKRLIFQHFWALLVCRLNYTLKSKRTFLFQVIIPLLLLAVAELFVLLQVSSSRPDLMVSMPPLPLETSIFGNHSDFYVNSWNTTEGSVGSRILENMFESPGAGPRCADDMPMDMISQLRRELFFRNRYGWGRNMPPPGVQSSTIENQYNCVDTLGDFDYNEDLSNVTYNEPIYCACEDFGWNCTLENWPWRDTNWIRLNTTDRIFDLSGKNLTQFRMVTRVAELSNATGPFFLGGFSLGHVNKRAQSQEDIDFSKSGLIFVIKDLSDSFSIINLNVTGLDPPTPRVIDPFAENITMTSVVDNVLQNLEVKENVKVWFNNKIWPSLPITSNILSNALVRMENSEISPSELGILTLNHPMNKTIAQSLDQNALKFTQTLALFRITCLLLVLSMIPAGFTVYLVEDRVCEAFHLQIVGGLKKLTYWVTSFMYDLTVYTFVIVVIMLIYLSFRVEDFTSDGTTFFSFLLLFFMHGCSAILYAYIFQKQFAVPALSFVLIAIGSYFVGIVCALTVILLETLMVQDATLVPAHDVCAIVFLLIPQYNLGIAIFRGLMIFQVKKIGANFLEGINRPDMIPDLPLPSLLSFDQMGLHVMCLALHVILATILLIFSQMDEFSFVRARERNLTTAMMIADPTTDEDEDVVKEKNRVEAIPQSDASYALVVRNLAKAYNSELLAVKGISFAVEPGECFGLLGLNGAGKTTTFSMLTAKIRPGHGSIQMAETRINTGSFSDVRNFQQLGYCPQFDALNMKLSTRENLKFYARIRGIVPAQIDSIIDRLLIALHLRPYANTQTSSLSGGNRRKLSVAVALVSQPSLIFLDEPSAGMDPGSQQFLWKVIERLCKSGKAVVLTSHSMEECEALCTRIAIMDRGRIRCLGGKQHLKSKFGKGSMLTVKLHKDQNAREVAQVLLTRIGDGARVEGIHCQTIFVHIEQGAASVAKVLEIVNYIKIKFEVDDFSLSQSTLDNVFQSIAESDASRSHSDSSELTPPTLNARNGTGSTYVANSDN